MNEYRALSRWNEEEMKKGGGKKREEVQGGKRKKVKEGRENGEKCGMRGGVGKKIF